MLVELHVERKVGGPYRERCNVKSSMTTGVPTLLTHSGTADNKTDQQNIPGKKK